MVAQELWFLGVVFEILATGCGTAGKQLIRLSALTEVTKPRLSWLLIRLGLFINVIVGPAINMASYSFAPQSLIAPFGGLDIVWNAVLAPYILKEALSCARVLAALSIVLGAAVCGVFGNHVDPQYTLPVLQELFISWRLLVYSLVFMAWFFVNRFYFMKFPKGHLVRGLSLGFTAGTMAGNMFFIKAALEILSRTINDKDYTYWTNWLTYLIILVGPIVALSNVVYMTRALQEYEALFMVTIYEGSQVVTGAVSGVVVLQDMQGLDALHVGLYWIGIGFICLGMFIVASNENWAKDATAKDVEFKEDIDVKDLEDCNSVVCSAAEVASVKTKRGIVSCCGHWVLSL